jgi:hypothetical protein
MVSFVRGAMSDPSVDATKLREVLLIWREMEADQAKILFKVALHAAQAEMPRVSKNGTIEMGTKGSIPFARYEDMDTVLRPIMHKHGFSLLFDTVHRDGGGAVIVGELEHTGGHSKFCSIPLPLDSGPGRNNLQAMGSTISYGKRYIAEMFFNIVREGVDDDGKRGGTVCITEVEAEELLALITVTDTDEGRFLALMCADDVRAVSEVERRDFARLKNALTTKRDRPPSRAAAP